MIYPLISLRGLSLLAGLPVISVLGCNRVEYKGGKGMELKDEAVFVIFRQLMEPSGQSPWFPGLGHKGVHLRTD